MQRHFDDIVSELTSLLRDGSSQPTIDQLLQHLAPEERVEALRRAKENAGAIDVHEGATSAAVGDRTGPAAGYDQEPEQIKDGGGVAES